MSAAASHAGTFRIPSHDEAAATRLANVLAVEAKSTPEGTRVFVTAEEATLVVRIEAQDARSLRAAANSILRLAGIAAELDGPANP